jgi:hypothetical protein
LQRRIVDGDLPAAREGRAWRLSKKVILEYGPALARRDAVGKKAERSRDRGILAAKAFPLFAAAVGLDEVVCRLETDPAEIRALFGEWVLCREMAARVLAPPPSGPSFDHRPNADGTCCAGHRAQRAGADQ